MKHANLIGVINICAFLAVINHQFSMYSGISWGQSAHFRKSDCLKCKSPHEIAE